MNTLQRGDLTNSSKRTLYQRVTPGVCDSAQLARPAVLEKGSVWNTMPPYFHDRRSEICLYFDLPTGDEGVMHYASICAMSGQNLDYTAALQSDEARNRQIMERIPEARWGHPADIGGAAVFLASNAADYAQGHILAVDGGWLAR